jgi:hypothetical protein
VTKVIGSFVLHCVALQRLILSRQGYIQVFVAPYMTNSLGFVQECGLDLVSKENNWRQSSAGVERELLTVLTFLFAEPQMAQSISGQDVAYLVEGKLTDVQWIRL